jgi:hypothetical protein
MAILMKGLSGFLPVLAIKRSDCQRRNVDAIEASNIHSPTSWIEPRTNEWMNSTMAAEIVSRRHCVELVQDQLGFTGQDAKACIRRTMPERSPAATQ